MLTRGARRLEFDDWDAEVSVPFRKIVHKDIRTGLFLRHIAWNWAWPAPRARGLAKAFRRQLGARRLVELPTPSDDSVEFIFLATNVETGTPWRFTAQKIGRYVTPVSMTIAEAVAASACFPPVFGPIRIRKEGKTIAYLTDGGVYDNTGMEPIWNSNKVVLISDAGTPFDFKVPKWFGSRIMRYVDIGRNQVGALRRRAIIRRLHPDYQTTRNGHIIDKPTGAFWRLASRKKNFVADCSAEVAAEIAALERDWYGYPGDEDPDILHAYIGEVRTDMDSFTAAESKILENHGYFMADLAIRRHARDLGDLGVAFRVPHRDFLDPETVRRALRISHSRLYFWRRWFA